MRRWFTSHLGFWYGTMSSFWPQFEDFSPQSPGVRASVMLRWLIATAPVVALASTPCVKDAVLTQELGGSKVETRGWPVGPKMCKFFLSLEWGFQGFPDVSSDSSGLFLDTGLSWRYYDGSMVFFPWRKFWSLGSKIPAIKRTLVFFLKVMCQ